MRVPVLKVEELNPCQRKIHDRILARRGRVGGPYPILLRNPELCERAEALSAYARFESSLPPKLRELALLLAARFWDAQYSWSAHVDKAVAAGISRAAVDAIAARREPVFDLPDEQIFYRFSMELLREHFVSDEAYAAAERQFGTGGVIDIVASIGNFSMLAMLLNAFLVDLTKPPPFADIGARPYER